MARIAIAGGGTGGHFYPGFALAVALRAKGHEVLFLVREGDPAIPLLEKTGFPSLPLGVAGLPRRPGPALLGFGYGMWRAFRLLNRAFRSFRPRVVVGMGAYISAPAVASARLHGIPVLLHESNAVFGLANELGRYVADTVCVGLPMNGTPTRSRRTAPRPRGGGDFVVTGTPIREALWVPLEKGAARLTLGLEREKTTVLVFGGSQGAARLNAVAPGAIAAASETAGPLQVLHLSGAKDREAVAAVYKAKNVPAVVLPYLEGMELALGAADLVISRSGASTLAELIAQRKPAVLVPFPHATGGHQEKNARKLESAGAAAVLLEHEMTQAALGSRLASLLGSARNTLLPAMSQAYERLNIPTGKAAVDALAAEVENLL